MATAPQTFLPLPQISRPVTEWVASVKALDHPIVAPVIGRVSQRRLEWLAASFRQAGLDPHAALNRARLAYAAYVGFLQLNLQLNQTRLPRDEFEAFVEHMMATLIP